METSHPPPHPGAVEQSARARESDAKAGTQKPLDSRVRGNERNEMRACAAPHPDHRDHGLIHVSRAQCSTRFREFFALAQYDLGSPSTRSAMKLRIMCGLIGAMRAIRPSRRYRSTSYSWA